MPVETATPGDEQSSGFSGRELATELTSAAEAPSPDTEAAQALIGRVRVDAATNENNRMNDMVEAQRRAAAAEQEVKLHYEMQTKARLAAELVDQLQGRPVSEETQKFLDGGGSLNQLLAELNAYDERGKATETQPVDSTDKALADSRREVVELSLKRRGLLHREDKAEALKQAESRYTQAFAAKLEQLTALSAAGTEQALQAGYLPQIMKKMDFGTENLTLEELAGNQLHVLTDMLCREQLMRQQVAEQASGTGVNKLLRFVKKSKIVRGVVAGAVFTASAVTLAHGLPETAQHITDMAEKGTGMLAAYITSRELLEGSVEGIEGLQERRHAKAQQETLASEPELADLTLRTAYNQIESLPEDRKGTADKQENLNRFGNIQGDYADLQSAPGGKPYSAEMMLNYCSQLYLNHKSELDQLAARPDAEGRKQAYTKLAEVILANDVTEMQHKVSRGRAQRVAYRGISLLASVVASNFLVKLNDSKDIAASASGLLSSNPRPYQL